MRLKRGTLQIFDAFVVAQSQIENRKSKIRVPSITFPPMLHYFKFRQDLFDPTPAKEVYVKRGAGRGWPEECPPIRAANAYGFDLLANFDVTFVKGRNGWRVEDDVVIDSDFHYAGSDESERNCRGGRADHRDRRAGLAPDRSGSDP